MNLRPYQQRAVDWLLNRQRAFVIAPAGAGKTFIAASAVAEMTRGIIGVRIGWLANTREQVEQAQAAAETCGVKIDAHCVAGQPDCSRYDILVVDEAHHMPAATWTATVGKCEGIIWGFSATPWSQDPERDQRLRDFFREFFTVPRDEVMANGSITKGAVVLHDLDQPSQYDSEIEMATAQETIRRCRRFPWIDADEHERRARWQATADCVLTNTRRNSKIAELATSEPGSILVLVSTIDHGEQLCAQIPNSVVVHAGIGKRRRTEAIESFRDGRLRCMIATSLADEGLDVPRASVLVLAAGGRSAGKLEQRAGRVMRPHEGKEFGTVHDFVDAGAALAHAQFLARVRTYKKLGYTITRA
jgi:superfamily II DNA or RNA helicase